MKRLYSKRTVDHAAIEAFLKQRPERLSALRALAARGASTFRDIADAAPEGIEVKTIWAQRHLRGLRQMGLAAQIEIVAGAHVYELTPKGRRILRLLDPDAKIARRKRK